MKLKIIVIYILSLGLLFLCSCSEAIDTPQRVLRANTWEYSRKDFSLTLSFSGDDAKIVVKDKDNKEEYIISGITTVTDKKITVRDKETLTDYTFDYSLRGEDVRLTYSGKTLKLRKHITCHSEGA